MTTSLSNTIESELLVEIMQDTPSARLMEQFGVSDCSAELFSLRKGFEDAENGGKRNLWEVRNRGYSLREVFNWTVSQTEAWIKKHQRLYEKGYDFQQSEAHEFSFSLPKDYVKIAN